MRGSARYYGTDMMLMHDVDDASLSRAVAAAFGLLPQAVEVVGGGPDAIGHAWNRPDIRAVVVRRDFRRSPYSDPTEWPIRLAITVMDGAPSNELDMLRIISAGLGVPLVGSIATDEHQDAFRLVFPDGYAPVRYEDDDIELTADDRRRMAQYEANARAA